MGVGGGDGGSVGGAALQPGDLTGRADGLADAPAATGVYHQAGVEQGPGSHHPVQRDGVSAAVHGG